MTCIVCLVAAVSGRDDPSEPSDCLRACRAACAWPDCCTRWMADWSADCCFRAPVRDLASAACVGWRRNQGSGNEVFRWCSCGVRVAFGDVGLAFAPGSAASISFLLSLETNCRTAVPELPGVSPEGFRPTVRLEEAAARECLGAFLPQFWQS